MYWGLHQLAYHGKKFHVVNTERITFEDLLPGWRLHNGLHTGIPDGEDLLVGMVGGKRSTWGCGVARWRHDDQGWQPISFMPVTGNDGYNQPSLVRDSDGSILFCARGRTRDNRNSLRVWRSLDEGINWNQTIDLHGVIANGPITLNQAPDGSPYIVANPYEVLLFPMRDPFRPPRNEAGRPRLGEWTREKMYIWPLNSNRTDLGAAILVRDCRLRQPADHAMGITVQATPRRMAPLAWRSQDPTWKRFSQPEPNSDMEFLINAGSL